MFERVLFDVLERALRDLVANRRALECFVSSLPLDAGEGETVLRFIQDFAEKERPIIHGFARDDTRFPVWSIVLASERETTRALGDESDDTDDLGMPIKASLFEGTYQVLVYASGPDQCLYLYALARALLIERRGALREHDIVIDVSAISGTELSPDQIYLPEFLFVRSLMLTVTSEQRGIPLLRSTTEQTLRVRSVAGVHVRDERARPDGIRHRVTAEPHGNVGDRRRK